MADNAYWPGQGVRIKTTVPFKVSGVAVDPTTVTLIVKEPDGTISTYTFAAGTVSKAAVGDYYKDIVVGTDEADEGEYTYAWRGTGTCPASDEARFTVKRSLVRA